MSLTLEVTLAGGGTEGALPSGDAETGVVRSKAQRTAIRHARNKIFLLAFLDHLAGSFGVLLCLGAVYYLGGDTLKIVSVVLAFLLHRWILRQAVAVIRVVARRIQPINQRTPVDALSAFHEELDHAHPDFGKMFSVVLSADASGPKLQEFIAYWARFKEQKEINPTTIETLKSDSLWYVCEGFGRALPSETVYCAGCCRWESAHKTPRQWRFESSSAPDWSHASCPHCKVAICHACLCPNGTALLVCKSCGKDFSVEYTHYFFREAPAIELTRLHLQYPEQKREYAKLVGNATDRAAEMEFRWRCRVAYHEPLSWWGKNEDRWPSAEKSNAHDGVLVCCNRAVRFGKKWFLVHPFLGSILRSTYV